MAKILLIEDDVAFCKLLEKFLVKNDYEVTATFSAEEAKSQIKNNEFDLIITDLRLPNYDGIKLMSEIKSTHPNVPVLLMTGYSDVNTAVKAMKNGAADYISKPFNPEEVLLVIQNSLQMETHTNSDKVISEPKTDNKKNKKPTSEFVKGISKASQKLAEYIQLVSPTNMSVLIIGESGTGKEVIAKGIHQNSSRTNNNFIAVDCGSIPKELAASEFFGHVKGSFTGAINDKIGFFEAANRGTLFLDEIGNLSYENQIQLLRALQERKIKPVGSNKEIDVDIRIITATNEDLREAVKNGTFREDLYHRINEFSIHSPSLVDRDEDLMLFSDFFLEKSNQELNKKIIGLSAEVVTIFQNYRWPGNLRELQNCIKRATLLSQGDFIEKSALPTEFFQNENLDTSDLSLSQNEKEVIQEALAKTNNNKTEAAKLLKINRKTLYNKLKLYNIN
ncbi:sigma-54-dependent Fis family transcriptional regulator [Flavobacterium sp. GSP27]|uniref:sigma-54-dependent transcriptional regulator n=1 Tax=unclassified Flavobacterium TaxID=196869 RepID=UPI000F81C997|nr:MULTISPECIES: sigma-54 dependent transcriptional regulator [unclassified Flavobacterium]RTY85385.1 sigma-54-dependent Fis family transcriptional regulator [Flavobacterium sp. LS1P28]RTY96204.1 sigma-54-dependent Fis family transcriptional regulator [Flavobacterium sp. GSN2]RTZ04789.1 sigma-54-dependent Fis family transcriptional regulator [Flavobacterium sp. GSP6]RTZ11295.1 sigma-54-dependent Fis family transcriptional regulator [Flavobacterium sp. GSP27]